MYLVKPILLTIMSSFEGTPTTGYVGRAVPDKSSKKVISNIKCLLQCYLSYSMCYTQLAFDDLQDALSPALETALDYYLRVLAIAISYAGPVLLKYKEELNHIITSAFLAPSWKVYIFFYLFIILTDNISNSLLYFILLLDDKFPFPLE